MQVGSLVECVLWFCTNPEWRGTALIVGNHYVIRDIVPDDNPHINKDPIIRLEEHINPINPRSGNEFAYNHQHFREIQPPMSISIDEIIKETKLEPA